MSGDKTIGVLALQGDFAAHEQALQRAGFRTRQLRQPADLNGLSGVVLPGGESTVMLKLLEQQGLREPLNALVQQGVPLFATCAGAILCSTLGWLPATLERNAYGDQRHSFITGGLFMDKPLRLFFIRAPQITALNSPEIKVHITVRDQPVLVEYKNLLVSTFHPELDQDAGIYDYWFGA